MTSWQVREYPNNTYTPFRNKSTSYATHGNAGPIMRPMRRENYYLLSANVFMDPLINFQRRGKEREGWGGSGGEREREYQVKVVLFWQFNIQDEINTFF